MIRLRAEILKFFHQASEACDSFPAERDYNYLHVITAHAVFLYRYAVNEEEKSLAQSLSAEGKRLLDSGADGRAILGEWYEMYGDHEKEHADAASIYAVGVKCVPKWAQLWIKCIGASLLAPSTDNKVEEYHAQLNPDMVVAILANSGRGYHQQRGEKQYLVDRWKTGVKQLQQWWPTDRCIRQLIRDRYFFEQRGN